MKSSLQDEIDKNAAKIATDGYPMSLGELINLYENKEIDIHPEFQRFFRWSLIQKSRLIESIMLGIPIPSIFVVQREDGVWDVVDGLQRLSTIFEFVGILRDPSEEILPPLRLESTRYLPSLDKVLWQNSSNTNSFSPAQRLLLKRAKLDVKILKSQSSPNTKYDLFQRLNSGGTALSDQELRNGMLVGLNKAFYDMIEELSQYSSFVECTFLSENQIVERYDMELVLRFIVFRSLSDIDKINLGDLGSFVTEKMLELAQLTDFNFNLEKTVFKFTFDKLARALGENSFRKFDKVKKKFLGGFTVYGFESIALGIAFNYLKFKYTDEKIVVKVKTIWSEREDLGFSSSGMNASQRLKKVLPYGRKVFKT